MNKFKESIKEILENSNMTDVISELEMDELVNEIVSEIEDKYDELKEESSDLRDELETAEKKIQDLENENDYLNKQTNDSDTLMNEMFSEWISEGEDFLKKLYLMEADMKDVYESFLRSRKNKIILVGKGGSGKDHIRKIMMKKGGFKYGTSYTTRNMREGEKQGDDHMFVSVEDFEKMLKNDQFIDHETFNDWQYGISKDDFKNNELFIMTVEGISKLSKKTRDESLVIYVKSNEKMIEKRLELRDDEDDPERRMRADEFDFEDFDDFDIIIEN